MQSSAWIALLQRIPPDQHDSLAIVTTSGIEISIQDILRTEAEYLVIRGRLSGTTDAGRVFFIPYCQIQYVGFQKEVRVAQILAIYGEAPPAEAAKPKADAASPESAAVEPATATEPAPPPPPPKENPPPPPTKSPAHLKMPRKSDLLERLRARAMAGTNPRPPSNP
jgi:hypothetical protein